MLLRIRKIELKSSSSAGISGSSAGSAGSSSSGISGSSSSSRGSSSRGSSSSSSGGGISSQSLFMDNTTRNYIKLFLFNNCKLK